MRHWTGFSLNVGLENGSHGNLGDITVGLPPDQGNSRIGLTSNGLDDRRQLPFPLSDN
jgi:hypothetical protein